MSMSLSPLERALGHQFSRGEVLRQALTHRSFGTPNYERLEFLGDSVLSCVISSVLYDRFETIPEGELSRMRATLVRQEMLHAVAQKLELGRFLRLGEGELKSGGARRPSILADALEAIFGAVLLDAGYETAKNVILRLYESQLDNLDLKRSAKDPKTALQEYLQARRLQLPRYELCATRGRAHAQLFEVECHVTDMNVVTRGIATSRRAAEQVAAQAAYDQVKEK